MFTSYNMAKDASVEQRQAYAFHILNEIRNAALQYGECSVGYKDTKTHDVFLIYED